MLRLSLKKPLACYSKLVTWPRFESSTSRLWTTLPRWSFCSSCEAWIPVVREKRQRVFRNTVRNSDVAFPPICLAKLQYSFWMFGINRKQRVFWSTFRIMSLWTKSSALPLFGFPDSSRTTMHCTVVVPPHAGNADIIIIDTDRYAIGDYAFSFCVINSARPPYELPRGWGWGGLAPFCAGCWVMYLKIYRFYYAVFAAA